MSERVEPALLEEFRRRGSEGLSGPLLALWWAGQGDWHRAHEMAQEIDSPESAWVHAYLHRREGDRANAAFWYRRAGRPVAGTTAEAEWETIVGALLERG